MLVGCKELQSYAASARVAVPAFNIDNLESAIAVAEVVRETGMPVIVQTIPRTLYYGGIATYPALMKSLLDGCPVDWAMHLDHGTGLPLAALCIDAGFSSVMYDGSALDFDENAMTTKVVVDFAHGRGISVEGELGAIGGKEESDKAAEIKYTEVDEAERFVRSTGVDTLAVGVGTAHGFYKSEPKINVRRIEEIREAVSTPLVLHGASGLSAEVLRDCISAGISKVNFATELRAAFTGSVRRSLSEDKEVFDPKLYLNKAIVAIKQVLLQKLEICYGRNTI